MNVVGAAIIKDGKVLAFRRSGGINDVIHKLEFVGGKVAEGETEAQALKRECMEELDMEIEVGEKLNAVFYDYPEYSVSLSIYLCKMISTEFNLHVHEEYLWLDCRTLDESQWAPADREFMDILRKGYVKFVTAKTDEDFDVINQLAARVMHATFDAICADGEVNYMINTFLSNFAIHENIQHEEYVYKIVYLNGEQAGFYAYCPGQYFEPEYKGKTYLSKLYLLPYATGKGIASHVFSALPRPLILDVKKDNYHAIDIYKHCGFRIVANYQKDIGGGYRKDGYVMELD